MEKRKAIKICFWLSCLVLICMPIIKISAASEYKVVKFYINSLDSQKTEKVKVGSYYIWKDEGLGVCISKTENGTGKVIIKNPIKQSDRLNNFYITNGKEVFYSIDINYFGENDYLKIYKIDITGKNNKYLGKLNHGDNIESYYNGMLYISCHESVGGCDPTTSNMYEFNIKTGKSKKVIEDYFVLEKKGQYLLGKAPTGEYVPVKIQVYDTKNKKVYKISETGEHPVFLDNKIYYADLSLFKSSEYIMLIKSSSVTGKNQKELAKIKMGGWGSIFKITTNYVMYNVCDDKYKSKLLSYNIKNKKTYTISKSEGNRYLNCINGKIYYIDYDTEANKIVTLMSCNMNGTNQKKLLNLPEEHIKQVENDYLIFSKPGEHYYQYYKYTYGTNKTKKINK